MKIFNNGCAMHFEITLETISSTKDAKVDESTDINKTYFQAAFLIVITATCIVGNGLLVIIIATQPKLRRPYNVYVAGLAVTDVAFCMCHVLAIHTGLRGEWAFSQALCRVDAILLTSFSILSLCHMTTIAINRYLYVCKNEGARIFFTWKAVWAIELATCLFGVCVGIIPGLFLAEAEYDPRINSCIFASQGEGQWIYPLYLCFMLILVPLAISVFCYFKIYQQVKIIKQSLWRNYALDDHEKKSVIKHQLQHLLSRVLVFLSFLIMYTPFTLIRTIDSVVSIPDSVHMVFAMLLCANTMVNPIIYGLTNRQFREGYTRILPGLKGFKSRQVNCVHPHHRVKKNRPDELKDNAANAITASRNEAIQIVSDAKAIRHISTRKTSYSDTLCDSVSLTKMEENTVTVDASEIRQTPFKERLNSNWKTAKLDMTLKSNSLNDLATMNKQTMRKVDSEPRIKQVSTFGSSLHLFCVQKNFQENLRSHSSLSKRIDDLFTLSNGPQPSSSYVDWNL